MGGVTDGSNGLWVTATICGAVGLIYWKVTVGLITYVLRAQLIWWQGVIDSCRQFLSDAVL